MTKYHTRSISEDFKELNLIDPAKFPSKEEFIKRYTICPSCQFSDGTYRSVPLAVNLPTNKCLVCGKVPSTK